MKDTPLSGEDIMNLMVDLGQRKREPIFDTDIKANSTIKEIFGDAGNVVLFHRWPNQKIGHWVILIRSHAKKGNGYDEKGELYYYDPLGDDPYNKDIIKFAKYNGYDNLLVNDIGFQPKTIDSKSCGRHCLLVAALNKLGLTPEEIEKVLIQMKKSGTLENFVIDTIR